MYEKIPKILNQKVRNFYEEINNFLNEHIKYFRKKQHFDKY